MSLSPLSVSSRRCLSTAVRRLQQPSAHPTAAKQTQTQTQAGAIHSRPPPPRPANHAATSSQLPVLPIVAIFLTGSFLFYSLAKSREGQGRSHYVLPPRDGKPRQNPNLNLTEH